MSSIPKYVVQMEKDYECEFLFNSYNQTHWFSSISQAAEIAEESVEDEDENFPYTIYEIKLIEVK